MFRWDFTTLQAINYLVQSCLAGEIRLLGDMEAQFVVVAQEQNCKVITLHIVGDGRKLRAAIKQGSQLAKLHGYEKMMIWTTFPTIARIAQRMGFALDATLPRYHISHGKLVDCYVLSLELVSCPTLLTT